MGVFVLVGVTEGVLVAVRVGVAVKVGEGVKVLVGVKLGVRLGVGVGVPLAPDSTAKRSPETRQPVPHGERERFRTQTMTSLFCFGPAAAHAGLTRNVQTTVRRLPVVLVLQPTGEMYPKPQPS